MRIEQKQNAIFRFKGRFRNVIRRLHCINGSRGQQKWRNKLVNYEYCWFVLAALLITLRSYVIPCCRAAIVTGLTAAIVSGLVLSWDDNYSQVVHSVFGASVANELTTVLYILGCKL